MSSVGSYPHTQPPTYLQTPKLRFQIYTLRAMKLLKKKQQNQINTKNHPVSEKILWKHFFPQPTNDLNWNLGVMQIFQASDNFI